MNGKVCRHYAKIEGGLLFICSNGDWVFTKDNLFTQTVLKKENYRGGIVKRIHGTSRRLTKRSIFKILIDCEVIL